MEKPLIALIEDDRFYASIVISHLESLGYRVFHETNGEDGLRKIKEKQPQLVLLDIGLPAMDGFQVLQEIRDDSDTFMIPVFIVTRLCDREDVARAFALGANQYLVKQQHPIDDLVHHVERQLAVV